MKTAVVILNWNTKGFLEEFLPPLLDSVTRCDGAEVIVADNASSDGSLELMKERFPQVQTIAFDTNYGFTGGYNKAIEQIERAQGIRHRRFSHAARGRYNYKLFHAMPPKFGFTIS